MTLDLAAFARTNKAVLIWTAFAALLYLFRGLFGLVFITYVMCFVTHSVTGPLEGRFGVNRRLAVILVYLAFVVLMGFFLFFLMPTLAREAREFTGQLSGAMTVIDGWTARYAANHPWVSPALAQVKEYLTPEQVLATGWSVLRGALERGFQYMSWFFLGLVFSFMIMLDLPRIAKSVRGLKQTRLAGVYEETADSVALFARVIGENFRAQIVISAVDAALMAVFLLLLGVGNVVLLSTLVFFCGLIPVLGIILSSVPIVLMAVNSGGIGLAAWSAVLIVGISLFETYVLNPRIVSSVMSMNPVLTLIILYIAYSLFGLWGVLLGVPVAVYAYRRITMPPAEPVRAP